MPKLELGDLEAVASYKEFNIPQLKRLVDARLRHRRADSLVRPDVQAGAAAYVSRGCGRAGRAGPHLRSIRIPDAAPQGWLLRTDFKPTLGKVSYHVPCHLRVQNIGLKTRDVLKLVPDTTVDVIERCSGHNGTYAVKKEFRAASVKIGRPVMQRVESATAGLLLERLPDGGPSDRKRPERRSPTHTPFAVTAPGLWDLRHASKPERRVAELVSQRSARARPRRVQPPRYAQRFNPALSL